MYQEPFEVTILGSSSALPTSQRYPSAQVVRWGRKLFLIDCGEGTQIQLRRNKVKFNNISDVFISHLHGDHCFGLIGLISTMGLLGRKEALTIHAHSDLETLLQPQLDYFCADMPYEIKFNHVKPRKKEILYEDRHLTVESLPLKHRVPTCGFLFREKQRERNLKKDMLDFYQVSIKDRVLLKQGEDLVLPSGEVVPNKRLTIEPPLPRSYAYCSDTAYKKSLASSLEGVNLLYHEATFLHVEAERAKQTMHSTARQAATIAQESGVEKLLLGHFSARYKDLKPFEKEARVVFPESYLVEDNLSYTITS